MNCKPGDLAVIVAAWTPEQEKHIGRLVTCLRSVQRRGYSCWYVKPEFDGYVGVFDGALRPIRPQADDAKDESLLWKPVPSRETESA